MRLLRLDDDGEFSLVEYLGKNTPPYAILSHTWGADNEEVTFKDITDGVGKDKAGYEKIRFCGAQAASNGLQFFWVDTCCIDKSSSAELSEAINSMFSWYRNAARCYVYLSDVSIDGSIGNDLSSQQTWKLAFQHTKWFTRGWTLQELIAPTSVEFFSTEGELLGDRDSLVQEIHDITGISIQALKGSPLSQFSVDERMLWAAQRQTKREEDAAYSLLGIFDIYMPLIYGEGREKALIRLQKEIKEASKVESLAPPPTLSSEYGESPPSPSSNIPFPRDPDYVDRRSLLDQIHERLSVPASRAALSGLGGVGKSQLAIEYTYRVRDKSRDTWVFWVHGSNAARYEQSFRAIADQVKIPSRTNPKANIFKLVHDWLRNERNTKWILVLDNVDNADFLLKPQSTNSGAQEGSLSSGLAQPLYQHLPLTENGSILITTRSRDIALKMVGKSNIIIVEPMDEGQALTLFTTKLGNLSDETEIAELAAALEFMPLAIVQAAAYIRERTPRCSVWQYMKEFRTSDKKKTSLLINDEEPLRRDWEAKNSILITWQISFNHILQTRRSAADLLSLMSFFDRQGIPEALVRNRRETGNAHEILEAGDDEREMSESDDSASETSINDGFEDDVLTLRNYSFISITVDASTFEMHRLVQLATRKWLEDQGQLERWKEAYIANLCAAFPPGRYENWAICRALFPHAKLALTQRPKGEESLKEWATLLYNAAWYAWQRNNISDAEKMSVASLKTRKKQNGPEHEDTLSSMAMLALAYKLGGQWKEAEELQVQVTEISKRVVGLEHPDTLSSINNLALTYGIQGRWKEAEELGIIAIETKKRVLGLNHVSTLTSMANLASTYENQGRWKEAEELGAQATETRKRVLGLEHPDTLTSMENLASTYRAQGRWKEAEELGMQVTETKKKVFGLGHPETLISIDNMALTYRNQGRWKEAEELGVQATESFKRVLGLEHPDTLVSLGNLALTYEHQGRRNEAEELGAQVTETKKKVLGLEHPETLTSMNNLAYTLKGQGHQGRAISLMKECFQLREQVLGPQHPYTISSLESLNKWQLESVRASGE